MQRRVATYLPPVVVALLALPFILHQNAWWEWGNAYWLLERQTAHVSAHGLPTLFVHTSDGAFNPIYVFYAGPLFSLLAYPAAVVGPWTVFATATVIALVAGYLGIWWTARNLGLSRELAILPALVFCSTPYVVSDLYGRGAWAELIAVNAVAVLVGAFTTLLLAPQRGRVAPFAAIVVAAATITGAHNLTAFMSAVVLPFVALALWPLLPPTARRRAFLTGLGAVVLGAGLTAAWLLPNLWYSHDTLAASGSLNDVPLRNNGHLLDLSNLFSPWPKTPPGASTEWLYIQLPALATAWALVVAAVLLARRAASRTLAALGGLLVVGVALFLLIVNDEWWLHFPSTVKAIQFPYRLVPYFAIVVCIGMAIGIAALGRGLSRRVLLGALVLVVGLQAAGAAWTSWTSEATGSDGAGNAIGDLRASRVPPSMTGLSQSQFRVVKDGDTVTLPLARMVVRRFTTSDDGELRGRAAVGDLQLSRLTWSKLVQLRGDARVAGHDDSGYAYVAVTRTDADGRWSARFSNAHPWPIVAGRVVSLLSAALLLALGLLALRGRRRVRTATAPAAVAEPAREPAAAG